MLPFGLITDVSAGALAAGTGNAQGAAQASGSLGAKTAFAKELSALEGGDLESSALEDLAGEAGLPGETVQQAEIDVQSEMSPSESGEAILAAVAPQVNQVISELGGNIDVATAAQQKDSMSDLSAPLPSVNANTTGANSGEGVLPGASANPVVSGDTLNAPQIAGQSNSPALNKPADDAVSDGVASDLPKASVKPTLAEMAPASMNAAGQEDQANAASPKSEDGQKTVIAKGGDVLASAPVNAGEDAKTNGGNETSKVTAAKTAGETTESAPVVVAAKTKAAVARRWQSELPQELRAPTGYSGQVPTAEQKIVEAGSAPANIPSLKIDQEGQPAIKVQQTAGSVSAEAALAPASIAADEAVAPVELAAADESIKPKENLQAAQATQQTAAKAQTETASVVVAAGARASATSNSLAPSGETVTGQLAAVPSPDAAGPDVAGEVKPVTGENAASPGKSTSDSGVDSSAAGKRDLPAGAENSLERVGQPVEKGPGGAAPIMNAVLASQMMADDAEITTSLTEVSVTGEAAATVRGGDLTGATRTESLQTPSQAQSGQVSTQVAAEIARNLKNGQTRFQMRFDPPELGRVEVNMKVASDGSVQAHLIVERPETLDMFLRDQRGLERALEAAGLNTNSSDLQFSLKQEGGGDFASGEGGSDQSAGQSEDGSGSDADEGNPVDEDIVRLTLAEQRGGLDFKV